MDTSKEMHKWGNPKQIPDMPDIELLRKAKVQGFSDFQIARAIGYEGDMEEGILYVRQSSQAGGHSSGGEADRYLGSRISGTDQLSVSDL